MDVLFPGGLAVSPQRFGEVFFDIFAVFVHDAEVEDRGGISRFRAAAVPFEPELPVPFHAARIVVDVAGHGHRGGVAELRAAFELSRR